MTAYGTFTGMYLNQKPAPEYLPGALPDATGGALANLLANKGVPDYKAMNAAELQAFARLLRAGYIRRGAWCQYHAPG